MAITFQDYGIYQDTIVCDKVDINTLFNLLHNNGYFCSVDNASIFNLVTLRQCIDSGKLEARHNYLDIYKLSFGRKNEKEIFKQFITRCKVEILKELSIKLKKSYGRYIKIEFYGLHQPQNAKNIDRTLLNLLLKRFYVQSIDLAIDFNCNDSKAFKPQLEKIKQLVGGYITCICGTYYINNCQKYDIYKIILYDKTKKSKLKPRHKNIPKNWYRLEIRFLCECLYKKIDINKNIKTIQDVFDILNCKNEFSHLTFDNHNLFQKGLTMIKSYISLTEASEKFNVNKNWIINLIKDKKIRAIKLGGAKNSKLLIPIDDFKEYLDKNNDLYSIKEVSSMLSLSESTIRKAIKQGELKSSQPYLGSTHKISKSSVDDFISLMQQNNINI